MILKVLFSTQGINWVEDQGNKIYVVDFSTFRVRRYWPHQMYVHLGKQCLIRNEKQSCWSLATTSLRPDLAASNRDGKCCHAPFTKFTEQTEGLLWEVVSDQSMSSSYSSSETACVV